jgi:hypothetical protein
VETPGLCSTLVTSARRWRCFFHGFHDPFVGERSLSRGVAQRLARRRLEHVQEGLVGCERARAAGAEIEYGPMDQDYGVREYGARDLERRPGLS